MSSPLHILRAMGRFAVFRLTGRRVPLALYWKVTRRCNLHCAYCGVSTRGGPELPTETLITLLGEAAAAGAYRVTLSGGEPLVRSDIGALIRSLTSRGVSVGLDTNGILVPERLDDLRSITDATVSLDGDPEHHDALRGRGSHRAAVAGVECLRRAGIPVTLAGVITSGSHGGIVGILDAAEALDARVLVQPATPWLHDTTLPNPLVPDRAGILDAFARLLEHPAAHRLANTRAYLASFGDWPRMPRLPCPGGRIAAVVDPAGRVGSCDFGVPSDPWRDGVELGFAGAFGALPAPPDCVHCSCATTASVQRALRLEPRAILDLLRRT